MDAPVVNEKDRLAITATIGRVAAERAVADGAAAKLRQQFAEALGSKIVDQADQQRIDQKHYQSVVTAAARDPLDLAAASQLAELRNRIAPGLVDRQPAPNLVPTEPLMFGRGIACSRPVPAWVDARAVEAILHPLTQTARAPFPITAATPAGSSESVSGGLTAAVNAAAVGAPSEHGSLGAIFALRPNDRVVVVSAEWDHSALNMHLDALGYAHAWGGWALELYGRDGLISSLAVGTRNVDRWFFVGNMDLSEPAAAQSAGLMQSLWQEEPVVGVVLRVHADATVFGWSVARLGLGGILRSLTIQSAPAVS